MAIIGIFFGSDTGNTENIAKMLQERLGADNAEVHDIAKSSQEDIEAFDILLLGIPTWYYGEAQCDWDDFFPTLEDTMQNTSVTQWELFVISLNLVAQSLWVIGLLKVIILKHLKVLLMIITLSALRLMKIANQN